MTTPEVRPDPIGVLVAGAARMGVPLDEEAIRRFAKYLALLQQWGRKMNLVSRLEGHEIVTAHFLDSLAGYPLLLGNVGARVMDIGAGAGFPSLPLKVVLPQLRLTLVESSGKKASFCEEVIRQLHLDETSVIRVRAEELASDSVHAHSYSWVLSRAVGPAVVLYRSALPFLAPGGKLLLYKGRLERGELQDLERLLADGQARFELVPVTVPELGRERSLLVVSLA